MKKLVNLDEVKPNPDNPRTVQNEKYKKLVKSIKEFPEMLEKRSLVVDENMMVLGGNQRLKACKDAGLEKVWVDIAEGWTDDQKEEFIIKDNVSFGEWDWSMLTNASWDKLIAWGVEIDYNQSPEATEEIKQTTELIDEMGIKFSEHHDYIVILFEDQNDWIKASTLFDLQKIPTSLSPKTKKIGLGRVISAEQLFKTLESEKGNN